MKPTKVSVLLVATVTNLLFATVPLVTGTKITAKNSAELRQALTKAKGGDIIQLLPIVYEGNFVLPANRGGAAIKIDGKSTTRSDTTAKLKGTTTSTGTVVDIKGKWDLENLEVIGGATGISVTGDGHQLKAVKVTGFSKQGIAVRGNRNHLQTITINGGSGATGGIKVDGNQNTLATIAVQSVVNKVQVNGSGNKVSGVTSTSQTSRSSRFTPEQNKEIVMKFYQQAWGDLKPEGLEKYCHQDVIEHNPLAPDGLKAIQGYISTVTDPPTKINFRKVIAEGDYVVLHLPYTAHGERMAVADFFRMENGKIKEHWDVWQKMKTDKPPNNPHPFF